MGKQIIKLREIKTDKSADSSCEECVLNPFTCFFFSDLNGLCKQDHHFKFASDLVGFAIVKDGEK